jgi:hypothetical protein
MNQGLRRAIVTISCVALMAGSVCAMAHDDFPSDEADSGGMLADLFLVRPLSLAGTVLGTAVFLVALPFTLPSGSVEKTADAFVAHPFEYTFNRPLGDFNHCGATRHACGDD